MESILEVQHLKKSFGNKEVLKDISLDIKEKEVVTIIGSSGSGKSTLLRCLNLLEDPTDGKIIYRGQNVLKPGFDVNHYRTKIGMVFQSYNLFQNKNVLENCLVGPVKVLGEKKEEVRKRAIKNLEMVGMAAYIHALPRQLSGGQQQRVAIARAVVANPKLILADEPTGNLDSRNGEEVMGLLTELNREGTTIVMVTHSQHDAGYADRIINLFDGKVVPHAVL